MWFLDSNVSNTLESTKVKLKMGIRLKNKFNRGWNPVYYSVLFSNVSVLTFTLTIYLLAIVQVYCAIAYVGSLTSDSWLWPSSCGMAITSINIECW